MSDQMLIDPIYEKFTRSVIRSIGSTEFYEFFMDTVSHAHNEFQFSNRKMEKFIDTKWIDALEESLEGFQHIIENPRNVIKEEELIVNVANAKKAGSDVVRHLAQHGSLVEKYDEDTGDVRPAKLMQKFREDSTELYENRLAFTVLEAAHHFVKLRHDALMEAMSDEFGAKLKVQSDMESARETVHVDMYLHIKEKDSLLDTDEKNGDAFDRISRLYRVLHTFMNTDFAKAFTKLNRVKGAVMKTNVLKKNPDYKKIVKLWEFLRQYEDVGYVIQVTEQNPVINEKLERDIYHNILFQYLILKGYLEDEKDREIPTAGKKRKRKLKPKVIRQIIEELTEDYDLKDVEIRKILLESLKDGEEGSADAVAEETEETENTEVVQESEEEKARRLAEIQQNIEDRKILLVFRQELDWFEGHLQERIDLRNEEQNAEEARRKALEEKENAWIRYWQGELESFSVTLTANMESRAAYIKELAEEKEAREQARLQAKEERQKAQSGGRWKLPWRRG